MLESFIQGLQFYTNLYVVLAMLAGVLIGVAVGIIPGIAGMTGIILLLPFVFRMSPEIALPLLLSIHAVSDTGGAITTILINVPGDATNAATLLDGYPMTQKGEGGRALGAALTASGLGGMVTSVAAVLMVPLALPIIRLVTSAEMTILVLMGMAFLAVLASGSPLKGLISGGLGLLISLIGFQQHSGIPRFTFGSSYLYDGIPVIVVALGIFAVVEMFSLAAEGGTISKSGVKIKGMADVVQGIKDVFRSWGVFLRSSIIGYIIGIIPGVGGGTAIWIAYGQAKQLSKHRELFGTGFVDGVIAPQAAVNAKEAGALLTTLALGIPGSAGMAVLIAALLLVGMPPGPQMIKEHLDLTFNLLFTVGLANFVATSMCLLLASRMAAIARVPSHILAPLCLLLVFIGAFAYRGEFADVFTVLIFGAVGLAMKRFGFSRPTLLLGVVLGGLFEGYLFRAIGALGPLFFLRPFCLILILIIIGLFTFGPAMHAVERRLTKAGRKA